MKLCEGLFSRKSNGSTARTQATLFSSVIFCMYPQYNYQRGSGRPPQQQGGYPSAYIESQRRYSPAVWDPQSYGGYYPGYAYYPGYYQQAPSHPPSGRGYHNNGSDRGHDRHGGRSHKPPKSNPVLEKARRTALTKEKLLRLKNEMCKLYLSKQTCYYYSFCQHAHGEGKPPTHSIYSQL